MTKRKLSKSERVTLDKIQTLQLRALKALKSKAELLRSSSDDILKKINNVGIDNHYSVHSDVLRYASDVWASSMRLGELKAMRNDLEYEYGFKKKKTK
jgi:hypothetical protein